MLEHVAATTGSIQKQIEEMQRRMNEADAKAPKCPVCASPVYNGKCNGACAQKEREEVRRKEILHQSRTRDIIRLGGERAYIEFTAKSYTNKDALAMCGSYPDSNLYLWGPAGVGKTHLSIALLRRYQDGYAIKPQHIFRNCRGLKDPIEQQTIINKYINHEHLLIDDLGVGSNTDFSISTLYEILDGRYMSYRKGLIITSNLSLGALATRLEDDRLVSRIAGMCKVIELGGKDKRISGS